MLLNVRLSALPDKEAPQLTRFQSTCPPHLAGRTLLGVDAQPSDTVRALKARVAGAWRPTQPRLFAPRPGEARETQHTSGCRVAPPSRPLPRATHAQRRAPRQRCAARRRRCCARAAAAARALCCWTTRRWQTAALPSPWASSRCATHTVDAAWARHARREWVVEDRMER